MGGAFSKYDNARHFGEIIWAEVATQRTDSSCLL